MFCGLNAHLAVARPPLAGALSRRAVLAVVLLAAYPASAEAQCDDIVLEAPVYVGDEEGEGFVDVTGRVARGPTSIYVVNLSTPYEIRIFDRSGHFRRVIGRRGGGPGEFRFIAELRSVGDTLHVVDRLALRWSVLDPDLGFVRSASLEVPPIHNGLLIAEDGSMILNGVRFDDRQLSWALHHIESDGTLRTSFDRVEDERVPGMLPGLRHLGASSRGGFWSVHADGSLARRYEWNGDLREELDLHLTWKARDGTTEGPPPPTVMGVREDSEGRLWLLGRVQDPSWREAVSVTVRTPERSSVVDDYNGYFDSVITILDPRTQGTVAEERFDGFLLRFLDDGAALGFRSSETQTQMIVWKTKLQCHPQLRQEALR